MRLQKKKSLEELQEEELEEWDVISQYKRDGLIGLFGERGKGKTTFAEYISQLDPFIQKSIIIVMCGSENVRINWAESVDENGKKIGTVPQFFVILPSLEFLVELLKQQDKHIKEYKLRGQKFPDHLWVTVILDDIALDSEIMNAKPFRKIVAQSRQFKTRIVVLAQNIAQIHKRDRRAFDVIGVCGLQSYESLKELYSYYGFTEKERFIALGMKHTRRLGQMFIIDKAATKLCQLNYTWPLKKMSFGLPSQKTYSDRMMALLEFKRQQEFKKDKFQHANLSQLGYHNQSILSFNACLDMVGSSSSGTQQLKNNVCSKAKINSHPKNPIEFYIDMNIGKTSWNQAIQTNISFNLQSNPFAYSYYQFTKEHEEQELLKLQKQKELERLIEKQKLIQIEHEQKLKEAKLHNEQKVFMSQTEDQQYDLKQNQQKTTKTYQEEEQHSSDDDTDSSSSEYEDNNS